MEIMKSNRPHNSPLPNAVSSPNINEWNDTRTPARINYEKTTGIISIPKKYFVQTKVQEAYMIYFLALHESLIEFHPSGCHESYKGVTEREMNRVREIIKTMTPEEKREFRNKIGRGR